jgi:hypothetical protein
MVFALHKKYFFVYFLKKINLRQFEESDVFKTSSFGEWKPDERDHEMTNFEKENPDVLMLNGGSKEFKNL